MNRNEFINYVQTAYGVKGDNPWQKDPESTVFRHIGNRKWFALGNNGFYPAYHMNKENWITAALDGSASEENIKFFLDLSFELTAPKIKQYQKNCNP